MTDFIARLPQPLTDQGRNFFRIWQGWRGERRLPQLSDIRREDLGPLADFHLLLEIRDREKMVFVSAGRRVADYLGVDLIGGDYLNLTPPENRRQRQLLTLEQLLQPCGVVQYYWLQYAGGAMLPVEVVGAPVCADGAEVPDYLIGCCTILVDYQPETGGADPDSWRVGEGMRFVDLGFGIPPAVTATPAAARHAP